LKKKILFISTNDGSDMRINKEIFTLRKKAEVYYLGVGEVGNNNYAKKNCKEFYLIQEKRNSVKAILKQIKKYIQWTRTYNFDSIHIINEQLMVLFYPFLFKEHVVLDVFDSIFMKINKTKNSYRFLKKIVYKPIDVILVTDKNRKYLMPDFVQYKVSVLENYPNRYLGPTEKNIKNTTIFYNGSMSNTRGTVFLQKLTEKYSDVKVIMAGWLSDDNTKSFSKSKFVDYRGVLTQKEAAVIAATESNYILCCYEPSNLNNINASPNKIYDAIQTKTPVIINQEVIVSKFVKEKKIGLVLSSFYEYNIDKVYRELIDSKDTFTFKNSDLEKYSWEHIETKLLNAHKVNY